VARNVINRGCILAVAALGARSGKFPRQKLCPIHRKLKKTGKIHFQQKLCEISLPHPSSVPFWSLEIIVPFLPLTPSRKRWFINISIYRCVSQVCHQYAAAHKTNGAIILYTGTWTVPATCCTKLRHNIGFVLVLDSPGLTFWWGFWRHATHPRNGTHRGIHFLKCMKRLHKHILNTWMTTLSLGLCY